jgi:hypothetical protein
VTVIIVALAVEATMLVTIYLFSSGFVVGRGSHALVVQALQEALGRERADCDYYRRAAQLCATALAHREGQVRTLLEAAGTGGRDGNDNEPGE